MRQIGQVSERWAHLATQATWKSCPQARAATAVWASTSSKQTAQTKLSSERRERREKMCTRIGNKEGNEEKFSKWMESYQLDRYPGGRDRRTKSELSCLLLSRFFWGGGRGSCQRSVSNFSFLCLSVYVSLTLFTKYTTLTSNNFPSPALILPLHKHLLWCHFPNALLSRFRICCLPHSLLP